MELFAACGLLIAAAVAPSLLVYLRDRPRRARFRSDGIQEVDIVVRKRYRPSTLVAWRGQPLRLNFLRDEDDPCSRRLIFPEFGISRSLPSGKVTSIELNPDRQGEFLFTCELGMYQGTLIIRDGRRSIVHALSGRLPPGVG